MSEEEKIQEGKHAFEEGRYADAIRLFTEAADALSDAGKTLDAAEAKNNLSVALLMDGRPREALDAAMGTDEIFAEAGDPRRQAIAFGNQAAALEALGRLEDALKAYERSAELFADAGESDLRATVLKSIAAIRLRRGEFTDSAMSMMEHLNAAEHPTLLQRILKFILRLMP